MTIQQLSDLQVAVEMTAYAKFMAVTSKNIEAIRQAQEAKECGVRLALSAGLNESEFNERATARYNEILREAL